MGKGNFIKMEHILSTYCYYFNNKKQTIEDKMI